MYTATLTSQGQITVPAAARKHVGLKTGDVLTVTPTNRGTLELSKAPSIADLAGSLKKYAKNYKPIDRSALWTKRYEQFLKHNG